MKIKDKPAVKYIEITENRERIRIFQSDIIYAEAFGRKSVIHTVRNDISTYLGIGELALMLDQELFLRCHRGYIVNMNRVSEVHDDVFILENGGRALISRRTKTSVRSIYERYVAAQIKEVNIYLTSAPPRDAKSKIRSFIDGLNAQYLKQGVVFNLKINTSSKYKRGDGIYCGRYTHTDVVKLSIALQLKTLGLERADIDFDGISLLLDQKPLITLDNIPVFINSANYNAMKEKLASLESEYWELRERLRNNPDDEEALAEYSSVSGQKNEISEAMNGLLKDIIAMETSFLNKAGSTYITPREEQAHKLFEAGDLEAAKRLLNLDEMMKEDEEHERFIEETQKRIIAKVSEYLYLADMLKTDILNTERFSAIERTYEQAVHLEEKHNLAERAAVRRYIDYLYFQKNYEKAAEYTIRRLNYLESGEGGDKAEIADYSNYAARCLNRMHQYSEAESRFRRALLIREDLAAENPLYLADLAKTLDGLARVLCTRDRIEESEVLNRRALVIYERLAAGDESYLPDLAKCLNNFSELYAETQRFKEAEELDLKAVAIHEKLAAKNPQVYEVDLARSYLELAYLRCVTQHYDEAELLYKKTLAIRKRLAEENPNAYEPDLAAAYVYLSKVYDKSENHTEAIKTLLTALPITERIASLHPVAYEFMLQANLSNLAKAYEAVCDYEKAEPLYKRALEISEHPTSGEATPSYTAIISYNLASLYGKVGRFEEAERLHLSSLEFFINVPEENMATYEKDLAKGYNGLAGLYKMTGRYDEAEALYEKALIIRERIAGENPDAFESDLAITYRDLAELYEKTARYDEAKALLARL